MGRDELQEEGNDMRMRWDKRHERKCSWAIAERGETEVMAQEDHVVSDGITKIFLGPYLIRDWAWCGVL